MYSMTPAFVLPVFFFVMSAYPALERDIEARRPLLSAFYISEQLAHAISPADSADDGLPPRYSWILNDYGDLAVNKSLLALKDISSQARSRSFSQRKLTELLLRIKNLPPELLEADPVDDILRNLQTVREKEKRMVVRRKALLSKHYLDCLSYGLPDIGRILPGRRGLPPNMLKNGLIFCGERIPLERQDVRMRIEYQIDYLLTDFRDTTGVWFKRKDRYGKIVADILRKEAVPREFSVLPALESGYSGKITSPAKARGWWQFVKPTATQSLAKDPKLDWTLRVDKWRDERCDLVLSTRSAARYLKWMRNRLRNSSGNGGWLTTAAAYNSGLSKTKDRVAAYKTLSYWDMKLPLETETYVPRWIALFILDSNRRYYGLEVPYIRPLGFETLHRVRLARDLPLTVLASLTRSSVSFIRRLNGALRKGEDALKASTGARDSGHTIHVPPGCKDSVYRALLARSYVKPPASTRLGATKP